MPKDLLRHVFPGDGEMAHFMRSYNWNDDTLGRPTEWPLALQTAVEIALASQLAVYVIWGSAHVLYNDAAAKLLGREHHPSVFARSGGEIWGDAWQTLGPIVERTANECIPNRVELTSGSTVSCIPLPGDPGGVVGVLCTCAHPVHSTLVKDEPATAVGSATNADKPRVLLIDRDPERHAEICDVLRADYALETLEDGHSAIELVRRNPPAALLIDLSVPGVAGVELLRALRAEPLSSHIPVVIISAYTDETKVEALCAGADDYVCMPFSARDLVERLRTQIELAKARTELGSGRDAARAKDDFLSLLGHELRNPLGALSTTVQALSIRATSPEIELMDRAVRQLSRLVDDLLDISRLSRGKIHLERAPVEIAHLVDDAMARIQALLAERQTQVFVRIPRSGLAMDCDRQRMSQVIANVLSNACKFSAPGASVSVQAVRIEERAQIRIKDSGSGIEASQLPTIFDSFNHGRDTAGLGIGLAIARNLVELHDGAITITSAGAGHGTECVIEIPVQPSDASPKPAHMAKRSHTRVLLVEDNHDTALALKRGLEQLGYQVALAHNGPLALTVARSFQPDVALLDIGLPVMDGWEVARRLAELRVPSRELHFVAVTARDQDADKQRSRDAGFADHLVKPIDLSKLERLVENLLASTE